MKQINIIVVDSESLFRQGIISLLKNTEIRVIAETENGEELISLLKTQKPDIILIGLVMSKLNGSKTFSQVRKNYPGIKVVIISRYQYIELIKDMFNRGVNAYLSKNSSIELIKEVIK